MMRPMKKETTVVDFGKRLARWMDVMGTFYNQPVKKKHCSFKIK